MRTQLFSHNMRLRFLPTGSKPTHYYASHLCASPSLPSTEWLYASAQISAPRSRVRVFRHLLKLHWTRTIAL